MSTEQSQADSVEAGMSALQDKLFGAVEPEAADEPQDEPVEQAGEQADDEAEQSAQADDESAEAQDSDYVEIEVDGEPYRVPPKLKDAVMASKDYTTKTQALAERTKAVDDRAQYVEARDTIAQAIHADIAELQRLEAEVKQFESVDWDALYTSDVARALQLGKRQEALTKLRDQQRDIVRGKAGQAQQILQAHQAKQQDLAREAFVKSIGRLTEADNNAMLAQAKSLGFTPSELDSKVKTDERILRLMWKAAKFDALQSGKSAALQQVQKAPPVVRPGAVPQYKTEQGERMNFRKAIKAARTDSQKADLIGNRIANKFRF